MKFEKLVQEDLNVGTGMVWVVAPARGELRATQIGLHSFARGQKQYTADWTPGAIAAGSYATTTLTVPDATTADFVMVSHDKMVTNDLTIHAHVSASNTVKAVIRNDSTASVTVAAGTLSVLVFPSIALTPPPAVPTYTTTATITIDGTSLSVWIPTLTIQVELWHDTTETEQVLGAEPTAPTYELIDATVISGGQSGVVTFSDVPGTVHAYVARVTGGGYTFDSDVIWSDMSILVDENGEDFGVLDFTREGA